MILVVEDEPLVRMFVFDVLDEAGYRVLEAVNAHEAISLLEAHADIRLVVSDIDMPGHMNGISLAHHMAGAHPFVPVVLVSGRIQPREGELPPGASFLSKPFDPASLLLVVTDLLDGARRQRGS